MSVPDIATINAHVAQEESGSLMEDARVLFDHSRDERLGMPTPLRLPLFVFSAAGMGAMGGMGHGYKSAGLKFLASNSHRLPESHNGWYFYHKRKGYYCLKEAMATGIKTGAKVGSFTALLFGLEAVLDYSRGLKDFGNTMMATSLTGFVYAWSHGMRRVQAKDYILRGGRYGIVLGLVQDLFMFIKGGNLWYLNFLGIEPMRLQQRMTSGASHE